MRIYEYHLDNLSERDFNVVVGLHVITALHHATQLAGDSGVVE